jgi:hypothetical protein
VGAKGKVLRHEASSGWVEVSPELGELPGLHGVFCDAAGEVWIVGNRGTILYHGRQDPGA